jgi:hypothetical protein
VLKKRQGRHEHDIRVLTLTDEGIRVGDRVRTCDEHLGAATLDP